MPETTRGDQEIVHFMVVFIPAFLCYVWGASAAGSTPAPAGLDIENFCGIQSVEGW